MKTKLNYTVQFPKDEDKEFTPKNRTKISMQAVVGSALASKMPSNPAQPQIAANPNGWGKNQ